MPLKTSSKISTHTLTWSVTSPPRANVCYQYEFQLTRSRGAWHFAKSPAPEPRNFNSHAHVERDERLNSFLFSLHISTHTLTWSVTERNRSDLSHWVFQLTRSRGAWLATGTNYQEASAFQLTRSRGAWHGENVQTGFKRDFNSHAHVERDDNLLMLIRNIRRFQLTRSRGAWPSHPV